MILIYYKHYKEQKLKKVGVINMAINIFVCGWWWHRAYRLWLIIGVAVLGLCYQVSKSIQNGKFLACLHCISNKSIFTLGKWFAIGGLWETQKWSSRAYKVQHKQTGWKVGYFAHFYMKNLNSQVHEMIMQAIAKEAKCVKQFLWL